jgi:hypothetical protein
LSHYPLRVYSRQTVAGLVITNREGCD